MTHETEQNINLSSDSIVEKAITDRFVPRALDVDDDGLVMNLITAIDQLPQETTSVVAIYGGAASGKTTLTRALVARLAQEGKIADVIGTDDYVIGDRAYRREHFEGREPRAKYDFGMLNQQIAAIRQISDRGTTVAVPTYNEITGAAIAEGEENYQHHVGKVSVLFVEGDFPEVAAPDLVVFLHVPDEERLSNRIGRDQQARSEADEEKIAQNFHQRQQTQHFPITLGALEQADMLIDVVPHNDGWRYNLYTSKVGARIIHRGGPKFQR